jgi:hypothetical protein
LDDHVLTLAQPFFTALVKQSGSPFYNHNVKVSMVKTPIIREPFSKIAIDIVGPLSRTNSSTAFLYGFGKTIWFPLL